MKKNYILVIGFCCFGIAAWGQIRVYPSPKAGFEKRIHQAVYDLRIIDSHEHLMNEKQSATLQGDIGCLFNNLYSSTVENKK